MDVPALQRCVGDVDAFFAHHWGRAPLLRGLEEGEDSFDDLASLADLDDMVATLGLPASRLRMVRAGSTLDPETYTAAPPSKSRGSERLVDAAAVYERFREGATIVLESLHKYRPQLADLCRDLESALGHRLQVNAYVTPPGSQGFAVHRDAHDVFVMQLAGTKHWIVSDRADEDEVLIEADLRSGSVLYIPKGFPHAASTGAAMSAHLTVGILTHDSIDVVREIVKLAEEDTVFRERLSLREARDASVLRGIVERNLDELRAWLEKMDVDVLTRRLARRVLSTSQPILRRQLLQFEALASLDADTVVSRRRGAICVLSEDGTGLKVLLADRELEMPPAAHAAMSEVARRERLSARDLHSMLTPDSALVLVRRLVVEGLLEVVVDD